MNRITPLLILVTAGVVSAQPPAPKDRPAPWPAPVAYVAVPYTGVVPPAAGPDGPAFDLDWNTIDNSGGPLSSGSWLLEGTVGQCDAGFMSGGGFEMAGGFWSVEGGNPPCYANCDASTIVPVLNINDFQCFLNKYAANDPYANCDGSTIPPVLNINDYLCFLNAYAAGCP